jgi:SSS family solute:Na+ symporter
LAPADLDRLFRHPALGPEVSAVPVNWVALTVLVLLFGFITVVALPQFAGAVETSTCCTNGDWPAAALALSWGNTLGNYSAYATLAFGSALALFLYPHSVTGVLIASNRRAISRNAAFLPAYWLLLALIALLGFMAIAAGVDKAAEYAPLFKQYGANFAIPALILAMFQSRFAGVAFAAIAIGALVPAAIMSIAASKLWTRNIYREFIRPDCTALQEAQMTRIVSLIIKFGALVFILDLPLQYAIQLQLLGGCLDHPDTAGGNRRSLYAVVSRPGPRPRRARRHPTGTAMAASQGFRPIYPLQIAGWTIPTYTALASLILNVIVVIVLTPLFNAVLAVRGPDETRAEH